MLEAHQESINVSAWPQGKPSRSPFDVSLDDADSVIGILSLLGGDGVGEARFHSRCVSSECTCAGVRGGCLSLQNTQEAHRDFLWSSRGLEWPFKGSTPGP